MKVSQLIEMLEGIPSDWEVVMSTDSEDSAFMPLALPEEMSEIAGMYVPDNEWEGLMYFDSLEYEEDFEEDFEPNAICFKPAN